MVFSELNLKVRHQLLLLIGQIIEFARIIRRGISHAGNVTLTSRMLLTLLLISPLTFAFLHRMSNVRIHILNDTNPNG